MLRVTIQSVDEASLAAALAVEAPLYQEWLAAWQSLPAASRLPLTHPAWVAPWTLHEDRRDRPRRLLLFRSDRGALLGALPVFASRRGGGLALAHLGGIESGSLPVPATAVVPCLEALFAAGVDGIRARSLRLHRIDAGDPLLEADWCKFVAPLGHRSTIPFDGGWPAVSNRLSKNFRGNLRKARNRLATRGSSEVSVATAPAELMAALPRLIQVDDRSWKHDRGRTIERDAKYRAFLQDAIARLGPLGGMQIHLLALAGTDIAAQLTLLIDGVLHVLKVSYDQQYADLSPGNLLLEATLRDYCADVRPHTVNLVTGLDWHANWRPLPVATSAVWLLARGWRRLPAQLLDVPRAENVKRVLSALHLQLPVGRLRRLRAG